MAPSQVAHTARPVREDGTGDDARRGHPWVAVLEQSLNLGDSAGSTMAGTSAEAEAAGLTNLGWTGTFEPDWQFTTINTNIEWANTDPSAVVGVLRALKRALHFMRASSAGASLLVADELRTEPVFAERAIVEALQLRILDRELKCSNAGFAKIVDNLRSDGFGIAEQ